MYHRLLFLILFIICRISFSSANTERIYFQHLGIKNKLSQSTVLCIIQDRSGFMWFGTKDGLNRYDGSDFRIFKQNQSQNNSLGNNVINALYENTDGKLWVGTDNGIYIYDPVMETFTKLDCNSQDNVCITQSVIQITTDQQKNIWIAVESQGVFCFDNARQTLIHHSIPDSHLLSSIGVDQQNVVWLGYNGKGLFFTDDQFNTLQLFKNQQEENVYADDQIFKIFPDRHNVLYTGSSKGGLKSIHILTRTVTDLLPASQQSENIFVRNIYPITPSLLWIATERGIYTYDKETKDSHHFICNPNDNYSLSDNAIYSICKDDEGGIWIGSYFGGIDYYSTQYSTFEKYYPIIGQNSLSGKVVREFCEDKDGSLWIGTEDGGLNKFNPQTKEFSSVSIPELHYNVHALSMDDDILWIGTYSKGLFAYDTQTGRTKHYSMGHGDNTLNDNNIYSLCHTSSGQLYVGTTTGLNLYNHPTDNFTRIHNLDGIFVFSMLEDSKGNIWFTTYNSGIFKFNPRDNSWKNYVANPDILHSLPYNKVISVYEDSKQRLWFSMLGRGFCSFNPDTEVFTTYDSPQELNNEVIYKIIEEEDVLWLTSNKGLIRFDPKTKSCNTYTDNNGLLTNQFNYSSGMKSKDGTIYFGSINGFISFKPEAFTGSRYLPPVVITDFLLFNKSADIGCKDSPLIQSITHTKEILLKYNQNSFAFRFAALCYAAPEENLLSYTLEGFDKEWYNTTKSATATYTNLKPGDYTFCIKTANAIGEWNENIHKIHIHIAPPYWKSIWAYLLYTLAIFAGGFYSFYLFRKQIRNRQQRQLEILESEKEKEIYHAKIDFFTNIAHEIRTPLTLIKGPLESILKRKDMNRQAINENLNVMERNTSRLLDLTNQLLDFRKTETKGFRLNFMDCNISKLIRETYIRFNPAALQRELNFEMNLPDEDFSAPVDKEALTKILSNLFNNAIKYAASHIQVQLFPQSADNNGYFSITVSNDGQQIPSDMKETIFEPFVQIKNTSAGQPIVGTGIGLPLARSLAELHRGKLYLKESEEICFCIELPINQKKAIQLPQESPDIDIPTGIHLHETNACILVVEDNPEMLNFVSSQLETTYEVIKASNGKEALEILENNSISLIVSDVMMPETNGFELCRTLKNNIEYSHIPIILLTAQITMQSKIEGIELGADDYIEKPFSTEYLLARIHNLLSNQEKLRQVFTSSPFTNAKTIALNKADESFLEELTEIIRKNISEPEFNVENLAEKMNLSRSSLHRKIKGIVQITPNEFIQLERLKMAAQLIQSGEYRINEVCFIVGFNSSSYFAKCFQKQFGVLPKDFGK